MKEKNDNYEIDIRGLFLELLGKIWLIIICCALAVGAAYGFTEYYITPMYQSKATIFVMKKDSEINSGDLSVATSLTKDYEELIRSRAVLEEVINMLDLQSSYGAIYNEVVVANPTNTRILEITVTNPNPQTAKSIADAICTISASKIVEIMGVEQVNLIDDGNLPSSPSNPNLAKNIMIALLLGLVVSCGIITILFISNDKIKGPEDIEKYLNLSVLGIIPFSKKSDDSKKYGAYQYRSNAQADKK